MSLLEPIGSDWNRKTLRTHLRKLIESADDHSELYQSWETECFEKCRSSANREERENYELALDIGREFLEQWKRDFKHRPAETFIYPDIEQSGFQEFIIKRPEFRKNTIPLMTFETSEETRKYGFRKSASQTFVRNFLSPQTPYNGILLWHEVGVGKTCAGISIAENFRDYVEAHGKKIIVLTPSDTLITNWRDEIFNVEKELLKRKNKVSHNVQCTGDRYIQELGAFDTDQPDKMKRDITKIINKYYDFMGYQKLVNTIRRDLSKLHKDDSSGDKPIEDVISQKLLIDYIEKRFSDTVLIMDEVHFTREGGKKEDKLARPYLELIARYSKNLKMVLATATPMYNVTREICWLLNLLLWNDKRCPIWEDEIFDKDGIQLQTVKKDAYPYQHAFDILLTSSRGYISFVRGENPFVFPVKLTPADIEDPNAYTPQPKKSTGKGGQWVPLAKSDRIPQGDLVLYRNELSPWMYKNIVKYISSASDDTNEDNLDEMGDDESKSAFSTRPVQASNIIYPSSALDNEGDFVGEIGDVGLESAMTRDQDGKYTYKRHSKDVDGKGHSFLHERQLATFSPKFHTILNSIRTCKGIVFVYSQFKASGVRGLALALEANGFKRYVGEEKKMYDNLMTEKQTDLFCSRHLKYKSQLTDEEKKNFRQASYILLEGTTHKAQLNEWVKTVRGEFSDPNINGELIKVILGSKVTEQGISFKRVREIHILEPWHHLNSMEQASGRGMRNFSHMELEPEKRNVLLYLHTGSFSQDSLESPDERIYRRAYWKKKKMTSVERLLKQNAVDCRLNKLGNVFARANYEASVERPLENVKLTDPKGVTLVKSLYDIDNTMRCDFQTCVYSCVDEESTVDTLYDTESDTDEPIDFWVDDIRYVKDLIRQLYKEDFVYSEQVIIENVSTMSGHKNRELIYRSLYEMIDKKDALYDVYGREGYLIEREGLYIFQPSVYTNQLWLPMNYRITPPMFREKMIDVLSSIEEDLHIAQRVLAKTTQKKATIKPTPSTATFSYSYSVMEKCQEIYSLYSEYVSNYYKDYLVLYTAQKDTKIGWKIPTQQDLIYYLVMSHLESQMVYEERIRIILYILVKAVKGKTDVFVDMILRYYDTPNTWTMVLRNRRDLFERRGKRFPKESAGEESDPIVGFMCYDPTGRLNMWLYERSEDTMHKISDNEIEEYRSLAPVPPIIDNRNGLFGYYDIRKKDAEFFIVNKEDGTYKPQYKNGKLNKKTERKGAVCGHAKGAMHKTELVAIIHKLLGVEKYDVDEKAMPTKYKTSVSIGKTLCQEIELLLRHHDRFSEDTQKDYRYFYRRDELPVYLTES